MKNKILFVLAIACLFFSSCKKEATDTEPISSSGRVALSVTKEAKWQGTFVSENGLPPSLPVADKSFIHNGYARIYSKAFKISKQNYYSTKFSLVIPPAIKIKGDSLNFEVGVKNPLNSTFYSASHGRDITLYIKGENNEASMTNVATSNIDPGAQERAAIRLGQSFKNNLAELQNNSEDYDTLILQTSNRGVVAYRNDAYLNGLNYGEEPVIGRLKEIGIIFKGSGFIDYVKIYNSVNGRLLMSEDFNTDVKVLLSGINFSNAPIAFCKCTP